MTSILLKADPLKFNPLEDRVMEDDLPATWTGAHVGYRLISGFETLIRLPMPNGQGTGAGYWPSYAYEWEDLLAQQEQEEAEKVDAQRTQNRARVAATIAQITAMEEALYWPAKYLRGQPWLMRSVNGFAFTRALDRDIRWLVKRRGGKPKLWRTRYFEGCALITTGLTNDKVPVS